MQLNSSSMHKIKEPKEVELLLATIPGFVAGNAGRLAFKEKSEAFVTGSAQNPTPAKKNSETQVTFLEVVSKHDVTFYFTNKVGSF